MMPQYPVYIPSKGRADSRLTMKVLDRMRVPYRVVVEEQELEAYAAVIDRSRLLVLDPAYKRAYDCCDEFGLLKSTGSGPARNFIWDHAVSEGHAWHWIMDDNIRSFVRLNRGQLRYLGDGTGFRVIEDFCARYLNVAMAGLHYKFFISASHRHKPYKLNTRIYSCNLIRNDVPYRWRARYNEDTDLSLRMLKDGWCTVLFACFLQWKTATQVLKGGNTDEIYKGGDTLPKSRMLVKLHPDVARLVMRYGRAHHHVDYRGFTHALVRRPDAVVRVGVNDYGLREVPRARRIQNG